ncbi:MAG: hypothetical protein JWR26_2391 [Pedosphaera sp.]|nr:hypothetical protein [Pedosphaera sp.]
MRITFAIILSLVFTTLMACADETLTVLKVGSDVYSNVTVTSVTAKDIYFTHDQGLGNAKLKDLEPALQKHFHYDAAKAEAAEQKSRAGNAQYSANNPGGRTVDPADPKSVMDDVIARVKAIVNQPVTPLTPAADMEVSTYSPGWFHDGATKPDFANVDVRATQEKTYDQHPYVTSDLNPGVAFRGPDIEFNSMTKYFYTDRSLPKKKLSEAEMLEINRLYRIIASCEQKLDPSQKPESSGESTPGHSIQGYISEHKPVVIGAGVGFLLLLLVINYMSKRRSE